VHVLVVEDDEILGELYHDVLHELGHESKVVRTAEDALRALGTDRPDLVLLDVQLPGMSGIDFLQLRAVKDSRIPIVVISGVATEAQARACLRLGAFDFVSKPVSLEHLAKVLECFEPAALSRRAELGGRLTDRRRAQRVPVTLPVRVREYSGAEWEGTAMNLSEGGIKVKPARQVRPGPAVEITLETPGPPTERLKVLSLLVRVDLDGCAFYFVNLAEAELDRLRRFVSRLTVLAPTG
jgi:DNA-binding response OmpR family regulator